MQRVSSPGGYLRQRTGVSALVAMRLEDCSVSCFVPVSFESATLLTVSKEG